MWSEVDINKRWCRSNNNIAQYRIFLYNKNIDFKKYSGICFLRNIKSRSKKVFFLWIVFFFLQNLQNTWDTLILYRTLQSVNKMRDFVAGTWEYQERIILEEQENFLKIKL